MMSAGKSGGRSKRKATAKRVATPKPAPAKTAKRASRKAVPMPSVAAQLPAPSAATIAAAKRKYEQGIINRGEAGKPGVPLSPGATHQIVGSNPDGTPILKRSRFSLR